ncbi:MULTISPECIES: DUF6294 family protein [Nocardia]|uniref:DUF6294 family protein n=1 Tax=Nocardia abscessus TaxID=120957 RepID=UPI001893BFB7|nr:DUF6294 family protein [Nocardia abscessus]MBF6476517.1 hypothetical protein [Nocardia abscessus]
MREIAPTAEHSPAILSTSTACSPTLADQGATMVTQTHRRIFTLAAGILLAVTAVTGSAAAQQDPKPPKVFWWERDMHAGDCTMFAGAHWVLKYDGTAHFTAKVTSGDDNDAWLMHARLVSGNGRHLGHLVAGEQRPVDDNTRFVINLPDSDRQYPWEFHATFRPEVFDDIGRIELQNHC